MTGTLSPMRFGTDVAAKGVRERRFDVEVGGRTVPGLLWTPEGDEHPRPVVMLGHGASGSKSQDYIVALARRARAPSGAVRGGDRRARPR